MFRNQYYEKDENELICYAAQFSDSLLAAVVIKRVVNPVMLMKHHQLKLQWIPK